MDIDNLNRHLNSRWDLCDPGIEDALQAIQDRMNDSNDLSDICSNFSHTLFIRLSAQERYQIDEYLRWAPRYGSGPIQYGPVNEGYAGEVIEQVALDLFFHWSWANAVLRHALLVLNQYQSRRRYLDGDGDEDEDNPGGQLIEDFILSLSIRRDETFPIDQRHHRVDALLDDELNTEFFTTLHKRPSEMILDLEDIAVAPHPQDVRTWRLLGYQFQSLDNHTILRKWPGVHFAATKAGRMKKEKGTGEYPYYSAWNDKALFADSNEVLEETEEVNKETEKTITDEDGSSSNNTPTNPETPDLREYGNHAEAKPIYEAVTRPWTPQKDNEDSVEDIQERIMDLFSASDVWEVDILCRMLLCVDVIDGFDQQPGTDYLFRAFERSLPFKQHWEIKGDGKIRSKYDKDQYCFFQRRTPFKVPPFSVLAFLH